MSFLKIHSLPRFFTRPEGTHHNRAQEKIHRPVSSALDSVGKVYKTADLTLGSAAIAAAVKADPSLTHRDLTKKVDECFVDIVTPDKKALRKEAKRKLKSESRSVKQRSPKKFLKEIRKELTRREKVLSYTYAREIDVTTHFDQEIARGGNSLIYQAEVLLPKSKIPIQAVNIIGNHELTEFDTFDPEALISTLRGLEALIGRHMAKVYEVSVTQVDQPVKNVEGEWTAHREDRSQIVMEKLLPLSDLSLEERTEYAENFIDVVNTMLNNGFIHSDLNAGNLMRRQDARVIPVLIDLDDVQELGKIEWDIFNVPNLQQSLERYDWKTDELNPPGFGDRIIALKFAARKLDPEKTPPTTIYTMRKQFIDLLEEKERFNAACTVFQLHYDTPLPPLVKARGRIGLEPDLEAIQDVLDHDEVSSEKVLKFMRQNFGFDKSSNS